MYYLFSSGNDPVCVVIGFFLTLRGIRNTIGMQAIAFLFGLVTAEKPGRVAQSVGHLTRKSEVLGSTHGLDTYFRFSFRQFQLLTKVCARSVG